MAPAKGKIIQVPKDPTWASRPDKEKNRQGMAGTFSKPLVPNSVGDPYVGMDHVLHKEDPLYAKKKEAIAPVFNVHKGRGPRLKVLLEPHDKWTANGPLRGFTPFKPIGGSGGSVPKKQVGADKKWTDKMQLSAYKFFGSSNMVGRGDNTHNIKQQRITEAIIKEEYNLKKLQKMIADQTPIAPGSVPTPGSGKASTRSQSSLCSTRSKASEARARTKSRFRRRANSVEPLPPNVPLIEEDPSDKLYSTHEWQYDNVLNPSTRYIDGECEATRDAVCPKCKKDTFFCPHAHDSTRPRRLGAARTSLSSTEIGTGSLAILKSPSPPRRPFSMKPGVARTFGGDMKTENDMDFRGSPPPPGTLTAFHNDRWK